MIPSSVGDMWLAIMSRGSEEVANYRTSSLGEVLILVIKVKPGYTNVSQKSNEHGRFLVLSMENTSKNTQEE